MSDAVQIRRRSGALRIEHSCSLPSLLQPPPAPRATPKISSREKEATFFGPSRGGCFSPPAVRPRLSRQVPPPKTQIQQLPSLKISNREPLRLEINVTQTKQTTRHRSNREKEACFSPPMLAKPRFGQRANHKTYIAAEPRTQQKRNRPPPTFVAIKKNFCRLFC
jgi:hypothetical protein